jgi:hypothetical protein
MPRRSLTLPVAVLAGALIVVMVVVVALVLPHGARRRLLDPPALPAPAGEQYGANVNYLFNNGTMAPAAIESQLAGLRATGAQLARSDAFWEASEPDPPHDGVHHYDWTFDDTVAGDLAEAGLRWEPIVDYTATWDQSVAGQDHSPPASDSDYGAYAAALARRYGPGGTFWREHPKLPRLPVQTLEIWNEPDNVPFWYPKPDAAAYAALYLAARGAIKAVDPSARVIIGGLLNADTYLPQLLAAQPSLRTHIDGVAVHPYAPDPTLVLGQVQLARRTLDALGMARIPLYATEFGWTTQPPGSQGYLPESRRPGYIEQSFQLLGGKRCGLAAVLLYTWVTPELNPASNQDWYGISPPGGGASPDVSALTSGIRAAEAEPVNASC